MLYFILLRLKLYYSHCHAVLTYFLKSDTVILLPAFLSIYKKWKTRYFCTVYSIYIYTAHFTRNFLKLFIKIFNLSLFWDFLGRKIKSVSHIPILFSITETRYQYSWWIFTIFTIFTTSMRSTIQTMIQTFTKP